MKEKIYLQQQLAAAINTFSQAQKSLEERLDARIKQLNELQSPATASALTDQERPQSKEQTLDAWLQ